MAGFTTAFAFSFEGGKDVTKDTKKIFVMSILSVIGVVATAVTGIRAGRKLERDKDMTVREKIKTYVPPAACALGTTALIFTTFKCSKSTIDNLNVLYSAALTPFIDPHRDRPPVERAVKPFENDFIDSDDEPVLFYDSFSNRYFEARTCDVLWAEKELNRHFTLGCIPCLNDFYDLLGLERTKEGAEIGWTNSDGDYYWIDFYHTKTRSDDGLECYILDAEQAPTDDFLEDYCRW